MGVGFISRIVWLRVCWIIWCGAFVWSWCVLGGLVEAESGMAWTLAMKRLLGTWKNNPIGVVNCGGERY